MMRRAWLVLLVAAGCIGDLTGVGEPTKDEPEAPMEPVAPPLDCSAACAGIERDHELAVTDGNFGGEDSQKWATCFSCRCKATLIELPEPEQLTCSSAEGPLARWRPKYDDLGNIAGIEQIDPNGTDTTSCMNPGMAAAGCDLQARFKRFFTNNGQTEYQQLCRKRTTSEGGYYEYLIIGHNTQNGATCFWQARNETFDGENVPKLDLLEATSAEKQHYAETFYQYSAGPSQCTSCHSNDAFLNSPYLDSVWSMRQANTDAKTRARIAPKAPYALVTADQAMPQPVVIEELTSAGKPLASACGGCHKVTKGQYCGFAAKSVAEERLAFLTDLDIEELRRSASHLTYWMPPTGTASHAQTLALQEQVRAACQ